jgi:hypothetical protein
MPLLEAAVSIRATAKQTKPNPGFRPTVQGPDAVGRHSAADVGGYDQALFAAGDLDAGGEVTLDLRTFTTLAGESVTASRVLALVVEAEGEGGELSIGPGDTDPIAWAFGGAVTLTPGTGTARLGVEDGAPGSLSSGTRNLKLANTGAAAVSYAVFALVGTDDATAQLPPRRTVRRPDAAPAWLSGGVVRGIR